MFLCFGDFLLCLCFFSLHSTELSVCNINTSALSSSIVITDTVFGLSWHTRWRYCRVQGYFVARSASGTDKPHLTTLLLNNKWGQEWVVVSKIKRRGDNKAYKVDRTIDTIFPLFMRPSWKTILWHFVVVQDKMCAENKRFQNSDCQPSCSTVMFDDTKLHQKNFHISNTYS